MIKNIDAANEEYFGSVLEWIEKQNFKFFFLLYSGGNTTQYPGPHKLKMLFGASNDSESICTSFSEIDSFISKENTFGILSYDLKNEFDNFTSQNEDYHPFPNCFFLKPTYYFSVDFKGIIQYSDNCKDLVEKLAQKPSKGFYHKNANIDQFDNVTHSFTSDVSDGEYLENVKKIQHEIFEGNVYEMNYCRNYCFKVAIDPFRYYHSLVNESPSPFSCLVKIEDNFIISNSMERFISKTKDTLVSQPIKGTKANLENTDQERMELMMSEKDKAENLMIVDLVRNDLNRISEKGSVKVDELFGIYSYANVHQMISSISSIIPSDVQFSAIIKALFPMGSMTGAPKISAINLIEYFESFKRGIYSGSIGYTTSNFDFDFNVVIRSALYKSKEGTINIPVGSAITIDSIPNDELLECTVKIEKLISLLKQSIINQ